MEEEVKEEVETVAEEVIMEVVLMEEEEVGGMTGAMEVGMVIAGATTEIMIETGTETEIEIVIETGIETETGIVTEIVIEIVIEIETENAADREIEIVIDTVSVARCLMSRRGLSASEKERLAVNLHLLVSVIASVFCGLVESSNSPCKCWRDVV